MREPLSDELFEVVLKQAVYDADKADLEELPSDEELNQAYPLPEKAHKEFDRLQKRTRAASACVQCLSGAWQSSQLQHLQLSLAA
ncbi:MAG: hypothetical protein IKR49_10975 [Clostridia bacterium]|nr:hypothetical protein [Clostridia bacterium]